MTSRTVIAGCLLFFTIVAALGRSPEVIIQDYRLRDLVYDPLTQRLYATSLDHPREVLQLDSITGTIQKRIEVGNDTHRLVLDKNGGLWVGLNGEGSIRRITLQTLEPGPVFNVSSPGWISDIAPAQGDTDTFAFVAPGKVGLVRDGTLLPDTLSVAGHYLTMLGNHLYERRKIRMTSTGLTIVGSFISEGEMDSYNGLIYTLGSAIDPEFGEVRVRYLPPPQPTMSPYPVAWGIDPGSNAYFMWVLYSGSNFIVRFNLETGEVTGIHRTDPNYAAIPQLAVINSNRVALLPQGNGGKLWIYDLTRAFQPAQIKVQVSTEPAEIGKGAMQTITVSNTGLGYATSVVLTNKVSASARFSEEFSWTETAGWSLGHLAPGESRTVQVRITPLTTLPFTNTISWAADLDQKQGTTTFETVTAVENSLHGLFSELAPGREKVVHLEFDPVKNRLFLGEEIWLYSVDLNEPELRRIYPAHLGLRLLRAAPETRSLWMHEGGWESLYRISLDDLTIGPEVRINVPVHDLTPSPTNAAGAVVSLADSVRITGGPYGFVLGGGGEVEFSSDGTKVYHLYDFDCSLRILHVTQTNITLGQTIAGFPCESFKQSGGWLYFNNGLVYDPENSVTVTNLNLAFPSFLVPDRSHVLHILTKSEGRWVWRMLNKRTFAPIASLQLPVLYVPRSVVPMGAERVGFVDESGKAVVMTLKPGGAALKVVALRTSSGITLYFATGEGERYQLQHSSSIVSTNWENVGEIIIGTGSLQQQSFPLSGGERYFRLARLP